MKNSQPEPLVLCVISVKNCEQYVFSSVLSVLNQSHQNLKVVVVDDSSEDFTAKVLEGIEDKRLIKFFNHGKSKGQAFNLKKYIKEHADGADYICSIDGDDILHHSAIKRCVEFLENPQNLDCGLVYTYYQEIDSDGKIIKLGFRNNIPYSKQALLTVFMVFHFRLVRSSTYFLAGEYNPDLNYANDYDLCLRLSEITKIANIPDILYSYRIHEKSMSRSFYRTQQDHSVLAVTEAIERREELKDKYYLRVDRPDAINQFLYIQEKKKSV